MRARSLELERLEDQIAEIVADLELYTYYQLLDLQPGGSCAVAEYNYNLKVYEYQKIQKDQRCSAALIQALNLIMDRMEEAKQVLSSAQLREEYDRGLEEGQTRHLGMVAQRASRRKDRRVDAQQAVLEQLTSRLQRTLGREILDAPEEEVADVTPGIESDLLDQEAQTLSGELASYGVAIDVKEEAPEEHQVIDSAYLEQAALHLRREIYKEAGNLQESQAEEEDVSADAAFVSDLTEQLRDELRELGVPEKEEVEPEALPLDQETIDRLLENEQKAVQGLGVDTTIKANASIKDGLVDQELARQLAADLEKDLGCMKVDYAAPPPGSARPAPVEEIVPIDLMEPLPAPGVGLLPAPSAPGLTPRQPEEAPPRRATAVSRKAPSEELERFELVIPVDEPDPSPPARPAGAGSSRSPR